MRLHVVAHRLDDAGAQARLVRPSVGGGDAVHVAAQVLVGGFRPDERDLESDVPLALLGEERAGGDLHRRDRRHGGNLAPLRGELGLRKPFLRSDDRLRARRGRDPLRRGDRVLAPLRDHLGQVFGDTAVVLELVLARGLPRLVAEDDDHSAVEIALRFQTVPDQVGIELRLEPEDVRVRRECDGGPGAAGLALGLELRGGEALGVGLDVVLAVALHTRDQAGGKRVDHAGPDAVKPAGVDVIPLLELPAGVQGAEDDLQGRLLVLRHHVHGDASAVVRDGDRLAVLVQRDLDPRGVAVDHLVDRVVEDLPEEVVIAGGIDAADVHRGPLADGLQALEDLDVCGAVARLPHGGGHQLYLSLRDADPLCPCATLFDPAPAAPPPGGGSPPPGPPPFRRAIPVISSPRRAATARPVPSAAPSRRPSSPAVVLFRPGSRARAPSAPACGPWPSPAAARLFCRWCRGSR